MAVEKINKERTLKVAMSLFCRNGIKYVSFKNIAKVMSTSIEAIETKFGNKSNLLSECISQEIKSIEESLERLAGQSKSPLEKFIQTCTIVFRYSPSNCPLFYKDLPHYPEAERLISKFRVRVREICRNYLVRGSEEGYFLSGINYESLTYIFIETLENTPFKHQYLVMITFLKNIMTEKGVGELQSLDFLPVH